MMLGVMSDAGKAYLRPVEERYLVELARIDTDASVSEPFEWRGFRDARERRRRWERDGYLGADDSLLVVALPDGTFAGIVVWQSVVTSGPSRCSEIGVLLFPEHRGRGVGAAAQLSGDTTVRRERAQGSQGFDGGVRYEFRSPRAPPIMNRPSGVMLAERTSVMA
jgi:RimJ/RimL family protein N-acetyltransferase